MENNKINEGLKMGEAIEWACKNFEDLTTIELYQIFKLRIDVFVVEQNCPYPDADEKDYSCYHLCGWVGGKLAAYARLVPIGASYDGKVSIGRVVTSNTYRQYGFGKALMQQAIYNCRLLFGDVDIKISAQFYLKNFYEGFGFEVLGETYLEDGIPHIAMLKKV